MRVNAALERIGDWVARHAPYNRFGDTLVALWAFHQQHGRLPRPRGGSLNDAAFFLKVSAALRSPERARISDKELVKAVVDTAVGPSFRVDTLAVLRCEEQLRVFDFPADCAIKPTHLSGAIFIRRNGSPIPLERIAQWFATNRYYRTREANYRYLTSKVIVEPLLFGGASFEEYKVLCVHGEPKLVWQDSDRFGDLRRSLYTPDWRRLPHHFAQEARPGATQPAPAALVTILSVARCLSRGLSFVRIDFYSDGNRALVGEMTNVSGNAHTTFSSPEAERAVGRILFGDGGFRGLRQR